MAALATINQLEARLGLPVDSLATEDLARAQDALDDASAYVRASGLESWTDSAGAKPAPELAVRVTLRVAQRIYENPQENRWEQLGDLTEGKTATAATNLLSREEKNLVRQAAGFSFGVYSVQTPA